MNGIGKLSPGLSVKIWMTNGRLQIKGERWDKTYQSMQSHWKINLLLVSNQKSWPRVAAAVGFGTATGSDFVFFVKGGTTTVINLLLSLL